MQKKKISAKTRATNNKKASTKTSRNPGKKRADNYSAMITIRDVSGINGDLSIAGRDVIVHKTTKGISAAEIQQLFDHLYQTIESRAYTSTSQKEAVVAEAKEIESAVATSSSKNKKMLENFLFQRLINIASIAPDLLDVIVQTLANPLIGLGTVARKIAKKAKEKPDT